MKNGFLGGMIAGMAVILMIMLAKGIANLDIEDAKTEHLTIMYKNSEEGIADKDMLVKMVKQCFPTSDWTVVDSKASKYSVTLDVWKSTKFSK